MLTDTHCHVLKEYYDDKKSILDKITNLIININLSKRKEEETCIKKSTRT